MSYTPTNWQCGDTISAEKLNKIEQGIAECCSGGGTLLLEVVETRAATSEECGAGNTGTVTIFNHSYQDVVDALAQGILPIVLLVHNAVTSVHTVATIYDGWYQVGLDDSTYIYAQSATDPLMSIDCTEPK